MKQIVKWILLKGGLLEGALLVLLLYGLYVLVEQRSGGNRILTGALSMLLIALVILVTLKRGYKGLSTVLVWISSGVLIFAILWLKPAGLVGDAHIGPLCLVTSILVIWDRSALPR